MITLLGTAKGRLGRHGSQKLGPERGEISCNLICTLDYRNWSAQHIPEHPQNWRVRARSTKESRWPTACLSAVCMVEKSQWE